MITNVSGMPDFIYHFEMSKNRWVEVAMRI
jgi:hypothetical protein